jgi:Ca-activated chloride channel family protein
MRPLNNNGGVRIGNIECAKAKVIPIHLTPCHSGLNYVTTLLFSLLMLQDPYTFRVDVPIVSVDVSVVDSKGVPVNNLTKGDFEIYEDGISQEVRFFSPISAPYNVFLLFDSSGSTRDNLDFMAQAAAELIVNLRPEDKLAIASFDDDFKLHLAWSTDRTKAMTALRQIIQPHESNETRFYAALDHTLRREFKGMTGRRAVVVLTDGKDTPFSSGSKRDFKPLLQATREQHIPVNIVALQSDAVSQAVFPNTLLYLDAVRINMQQLADNSGGEILFSKDFDDVARLYEQIGHRLGTSYSLGYVPSNAKRDGSFRKIDVKTRDRDFHLTQSRLGYYTSPKRAVLNFGFAHTLLGDGLRHLRSIQD